MRYAPISEFTFHAKLYEITGNKTIMEFQEIIHPVMEFVKKKFKELLEPINIQIKQKGELSYTCRFIRLYQKRR